MLNLSFEYLSISKVSIEAILLGFKVIIFSNSGKKRLQPFKEELAVDVCPRAFKPSTKKFISIMKELKYQYQLMLVEK